MLTNQKETTCAKSQHKHILFIFKKSSDVLFDVLFLILLFKIGKTYVIFLWQ